MYEVWYTASDNKDYLDSTYNRLISACVVAQKVAKREGNAYVLAEDGFVEDEYDCNGKSILSTVKIKK